MFEVMFLTGLTAAVLSQFLPEERRPPVTRSTHNRCRTEHRKQSGKTKRHLQQSPGDTAPATTDRSKNDPFSLRFVA